MNIKLTMIKKSIGIFTLLLFISMQATAQKYGFVNTQAILMDLPEVKAANDTIEAFKMNLQKQGELMVASFQEKARMLEAKRPELPPIEFERQVQALQAEQAQLQDYEGNSQNQLYQKSAELLGPVEQKINKAILDLASEEGYTYIFDVSQGFILYADPASDLSEKVKLKIK